MPIMAAVSLTAHLGCKNFRPWGWAWGSTWSHKIFMAVVLLC